MSIDIFVVLAATTILNTNDLNAAAKNFEPTVSYSENIDLNKHSGFLPVELGEIKSGIETYMMPFSEVQSFFPENEDINPKASIVLQISWGGDINEGAVALYTATVLVSFFNGIALEGESGAYISAQELSQGYQMMLSGDF